MGWSVLFHGLLDDLLPLEGWSLERHHLRFHHRRSACHSWRSECRFQECHDGRSDSHADRRTVHSHYKCVHETTIQDDGGNAKGRDGEDIEINAQRRHRPMGSRLLGWLGQGLRGTSIRVADRQGKVIHFLRRRMWLCSITMNKLAVINKQIHPPKMTSPLLAPTHESNQALTEESESEVNCT